jgi:hypothetical protein
MHARKAKSGRRASVQARKLDNMANPGLFRCVDEAALGLGQLRISRRNQKKPLNAVQRSPQRVR